MSMKSLSLIFFCVAFVACAFGDTRVLRNLHQDSVTKQLQMAMGQRDNFSKDMSVDKIIFLNGRPMVACSDSSCCPKHYHHCCESGKNCCDFTGRRSTTYSCY
nr:uncharacterized protein LOC112210580 [Halyomorpha halys]